MVVGVEVQDGVQLGGAAGMLQKLHCEPVGKRVCVRLKNVYRLM